MSYEQSNTSTNEDLLLSCAFPDQEQETKIEKVTAASIPQYEIDALARAFLPAILEFYRSEEGQREFAAWKADRYNQKLNKKPNNKNN